MRKAVKIKTLPVLFAWLVIFAHSVIPHNHLPENFAGCNKLIHEIKAACNDCESITKYETQPGSTNVCHFSNFLFNQFSQDHILISTTRETHIYPVLITGAILANRTKLFLSEPYHGSSTLRAPPSV